jgi:hypothetical protein
MSRSNKPRYGTKTKKWKDTVRRSRVHARTRSRMKKVTKNMPGKQSQSRKPPKPAKPVDFEDQYHWDGHKWQGPIIDWSTREPELSMDHVKRNMIRDLKEP